MKRVLACVGVVLVAAFGAVACGDDDDDAGQATAEAAVCTSLQGVSSAVDQVEGVQLGDPEGNAQNISVKRVQATWSGVEQSARRPQRGRRGRAGLGARRPRERG